MDEFQSWVKRLRRKFPPLLPTRVYRRDLSKEDHEACTILTYDLNNRPKYFTIFIHKGSRSLIKHMLVHEWAHAYCWQEGQNVEHHGPEWGLSMSKIYQFLFEE